MAFAVTRLHVAVNGFAARGGSSIVEVAGKAVVFGGADREQTHFQDMLVYRGVAGLSFSAVTATGDVPMPRSGHGVVAYGKYMFLFGGIDFAEEAVFNDLYILDTETFEWGYVGESGEEVVARNSHSLGIVRLGGVDYLALYGGASPEHGPLGDTLLAALPTPDAIDMKSIYVKWEALAAPVPSTVLTGAVATATALQGPGKREMHGTCCFDGRMYISGGRNEEQMFSDVWMLAASPAPEAEGAAIQRVQWTRLTALDLPTPRCAHGAAVVVTAGNEGVAARLVLVAGFTSSGISAECLTIELPNFGTPTTQGWKSQALGQPIAGRFGLAACSTSIRFVDHISGNPLYAPIFNAPMREAIAGVRARIAATEDQEDSEKAQQQEHVAMLLFGGVSPEEDFADLHLLLVQ